MTSQSWNCMNAEMSLGCTERLGSNFWLLLSLSRFTIKSLSVVILGQSTVARTISTPCQSLESTREVIARNFFPLYIYIYIYTSDFDPLKLCGTPFEHQMLGLMVEKLGTLPPSTASACRWTLLVPGMRAPLQKGLMKPKGLMLGIKTATR